MKEKFGLRVPCYIVFSKNWMGRTEALVQILVATAWLSKDVGANMMPFS